MSRSEYRWGSGDAALAADQHYLTVCSYLDRLAVDCHRATFGGHLRTLAATHLQAVALPDLGALILDHLVGSVAMSQSQRPAG